MCVCVCVCVCVYFFLTDVTNSTMGKVSFFDGVNIGAYVTQGSVNRVSVSIPAKSKYFLTLSLSLSLSVHLCLSLSVSLSFSLCLSFSVCLSVCLSLSLSLSLPLYQSTFTIMHIRASSYRVFLWWWCY